MKARAILIMLTITVSVVLKYYLDFLMYLGDLL